MERLTDMRALAAVAVLLLLPTQAQALTIYGYNDNGRQYIGHVTRGVTTSQWLCDDGPSAGDAVWTNLGNSTSLTDDYAIHADASSGTGGNDIIQIIRANTTISGECAATSGQWGPLRYGAYYLHIYGDGGNDEVFGGSGVTYAYGNAGDDYVTQYSGSGRAYGGDGADNLFGNAGSGNTLYGEAGNDCIQAAANNNWTVYDCGTGTDRWYHTNTGAGKVSCENREDWCCGFC